MAPDRDSTSTAESEERLQGLTDRLEEVDGGERLREDLADLEERLDEALSPG